MRCVASGRAALCTLATVRVTHCRITMSSIINARIPLRVEQKLADYCAKRGVTRTEAVVNALDQYLDRDVGGASAFSLAADLIPARGVKELQSENARELARKAFRGSRSR